MPRNDINSVQKLASGTVLGLAFALNSGLALAENEVIVSKDLTIDIPLLLYSGQPYSAQMKHNGSCWDVSRITEIKEQVPAGSNSAVKSATAGHGGFDFSTGTVDPQWEQQDFYISLWAQSKYPEGYARLDAVWPSGYDYKLIVMMDKGAVALDSITQIPPEAEWVRPEGGSVDYPFKVGNVYIMKARDGYAKIKVTAISPANGPYSIDDIDSVKVSFDYVYTSGSSF